MVPAAVRRVGGCGPARPRPYARRPMSARRPAATLARLATLAAALALLVAARRSARWPTRRGARAMGPLPACRYDDILTTPRGYEDWSITLVDTILRVPEDYVPPDLVAVVAGRASPASGKVRAVDDRRPARDERGGRGRRRRDRRPERLPRATTTQQAVFDELGRRLRLRARARALGAAGPLRAPARPGHRLPQRPGGGRPVLGHWARDRRPASG